MIRFENGRAWSERTTDEDLSLLQKDLEALDPEELEVLRVMLQELRGGSPRGTSLLTAMSEVEWERQPVPVEQFITDPYYLGNTCDVTYPKLRKDIADLFAGNYYEAIWSGAIGYGKCLAPSSSVVDGVTGERRSICEAVGRPLTVPSLDGERIVHRAVPQVWASGTKPCAKLVLASGQWLEASLDHPVRVPSGYAPLGDLRPGDLVAVARTVPPPISPLVVADAVVQAVACLVADGGMTNGNTIYSKGDATVFQGFLASAPSLPGFAGFGEVQVQKGCYRVNVRGVQEYTRELGIRCMSREKRVPRMFFGLGDRQLALFLRYLYTDGSVYERAPHRIELVLASEGLVDDVQYLLRRFGVVARKTFKAASIQHRDGTKTIYPAWRLWIADAPNIQRFFETVGLIPGKEAVCARVWERAKALRSNTNWDVVPVGVAELREIRRAVGPVSRREWAKVGGIGPGGRMGRDRFRRLCEQFGYKGRYRVFADMDVVWEKVVNIAQTGVQPVYDLTVPGTENAVVNGIIVHNSFISSICICRVIYELSCLRDPYKSYGLAPGSNLSIVCLSVSELLAQKVVFESISAKVKASPYFSEHFPYDATKKELRFPKGIWVAARASTDTSALGLNVIAAFMDEASFLPDTAKAVNERMGLDIKSRAESIYNGLKRRLKSRFMRQGRVPGLLVVASSKRTRDDFVSKTIERSRNDPTVFVRDYAAWDVKPEDNYNAGRFWVLCGNETVPSKILDTEAEAEALRPTLPPDVVLLPVPDDWRPDFESDLESSIRDIAGISTVAMCPFIQRREKLLEAVDKGRSHPFTAVVHDPSMAGTFLWPLLASQVTVGRSDPKWVPKVNPQAPRYVHLDQSLRRDATGICMGHQAGWKDVVRRDREGALYTERAPIIYYDFMLRVVPPAGNEIDLGDLRQLIYDLSAHGFHIVGVTMDSYNSADALQMLAKRGYKAEVLSVDRTTEPYDTLKTALYEGRVRYYHYEPVLEELRALEMDYRRRKVDHPKRMGDGRPGRKDVADCLAAVAATLSANQFGEGLPILPGLTYGGEDRARTILTDPARGPLLPLEELGVGEGWYDLGGSTRR